MSGPRLLLLGACLAAAAPAASPRERLVTLMDGTAFTFVEVPAGRFTQGSPATEAGRAADEGPAREVTLSRPFWLGKFEVTQAQWAAVMKDNPAMFRDFPASARHPVEGVSWLDAQGYLERLNGLGLGRFRLPTEAEWEYAARAGSTTRFPWGDDPAFRALPRHGWFYPRSEGRSHPVGLKEPNPWGLHDILGNVMEWTLDQYAANSYGSAAPKNPWNKATKPYPHVARGGAWDDDSADKLRVANRRFSDPDWKIQDPQFPKSIWYHTDAQFLGFRVVRPLETPSAEDMQKYWNSGVEKE